MKKYFKLIGITVALCGLVTVSSCGKDPEPTPPTPPTPPVTDVDVKGVSLSKKEATMVVNETITLEAIIDPTDATENGVTWSSSNPYVLTVTGNGFKGTVKSHDNTGTAYIKVTTKDGNFTDSCKVTIQKGIENDENKITMTFEDYLSWPVKKVEGTITTVTSSGGVTADLVQIAIYGAENETTAPYIFFTCEAAVTATGMAKPVTRTTSIFALDKFVNAIGDWLSRKLDNSVETSVLLRVTKFDPDKLTISGEMAGQLFNTEDVVAQGEGAQIIPREKTMRVQFENVRLTRIDSNGKK